MDERRREIVGIVCDPARRETSIDGPFDSTLILSLSKDERVAQGRHQPIALQIFQRSVYAQPQRVRELAKAPRFAAARAAGHQRVAPVQTRARVKREIELLLERGAGEGDHGIPVAMQLGILGDAIRVMNDSGGLGSSLRRRPRRRRVDL